MMSNEVQPTTTPTTTPPLRYAVFAVTEKGDRSFFTRIGVAFKNRDASMTARLDAMPVSGTIHIREEEARPRVAAPAGPGGAS